MGGDVPVLLTASALARYGQAVVEAIEHHLPGGEAEGIRTWSENARCSACAGRALPGIAHSVRAWNAPLRERLARKGAGALDRALEHGDDEYEQVGLVALLQVASGQSCPQVLAHPEVAGPVAPMTPGEELEWNREGGA